MDNRVSAMTSGPDFYISPRNITEFSYDALNSAQINSISGGVFPVSRGGEQWETSPRFRRWETGNAVSRLLLTDSLNLARDEICILWCVSLFHAWKTLGNSPLYPVLGNGKRYGGLTSSNITRCHYYRSRIVYMSLYLCYYIIIY